jgi:hypothetical protein
MTAIARTYPVLARLLEPAALARGVIAGVAWGVALTAGLLAFSVWQCGSICIEEAISTATLSIGVGLLTMGPLAIFGRISR